ncbi:MAG: hypothetical protein K6G22_06690 [Lachnospiraceae bacterium]|nr:hypothetical protein [Lachnospiraceae bacterium]
MNYISVSETAKRWNITERAVRNYLVEGRIPGAFMTGKTWVVPDEAKKPDRKPRARTMPMFLSERLKYEKKNRITGGIYETFQIKTAYHSNHIAGNPLSLEDVTGIITKNCVSGENLDIDDILLILNHYRAMNHMIDSIDKPVSESFIDRLYHLMSAGIRNKKGVQEFPDKTESRPLSDILREYNDSERVSFEDILGLHSDLMKAGPCKNYNGQIARLILFKECIKNKFIPFVMDDELKLSYYRGIREWDHEQWYLTDTCRIAQDRMTEILNEYDILL